MALDTKTRTAAASSFISFASAVVIVAISGHYRTLWAFPVVAVLTLSAWFSATFAARRVRREGLLPGWARIAIPAFALVATVFGYAAFDYIGVDGGALTMLCLAFISYGLLVSEIRHRESGVLAGGVVVLGVAGIGIALAAGLAGEYPNRVWVVLAALAVLPAGLTWLAEGVIRRRWLGSLGFVLIGVAIVCAGGAWLSAVEVPGLYVVAAMVVAVLLVLALASDTHADLLIIATVLALVWVGLPRSVPHSEEVIFAPVYADDIEPGERVIVALGDSFIAGEGARAFYSGTNDRRTFNECRRAPTSYPALLADDPRTGGQRVALFACSGATTLDVAGKVVSPQAHPQSSGEPPGTGGLYQYQQLATLVANQGQPSLIVLSLGGNDLGFGEITTACISPGDCTERGQLWLDRLEEVGTKLDAAYAQIRAVAPNVPVLVVPYPRPLNADWCDYSLMTPSEHRFLDGLVRQLDATVRTSTHRAQFHYLDAMETVLVDSGLAICSDPKRGGDIGVNFIALSSVDGLVDQMVNPANWLHNSFHPNEIGHRAMEDVLARWIEENPEPPAIAPPKLNSIAVTALPEMLGDLTPPDYCGRRDSAVDDCDLSDRAWAAAQAGEFGRETVGAVAVIILGAWILSVSIVTQVRPLVRRRNRATASRNG